MFLRIVILMSVVVVMASKFEYEKGKLYMRWYDWFFDCIKNKYFMFDGRARRSEYWYYLIVWAIIYFVLLFLSTIPIVGFFAYYIKYGFCVATLFPSLAVMVRRLHDTGKSGWLVILSFIPFANLVLIFFFAQDSHQGENKYGANPKA